MASLSEEEIKSAVLEENRVPEYVSIKSKGVLKDGKGQQSFTMNLRMRKDSLIWVSLSAFGLEAGRALLLPDSIVVIDRLNKKYFKYDYSYLSQIAKMPVNMRQVQLLISGCLLYPADKYRYSLTEDVWQLLFTDLYQEHRLMVNNQFKVSEGVWTQLAELRSLETNYFSYTKADEVWLPWELRFSMTSGNQTSVLTLNHSHVNTEKIDQFPFSIPQNYRAGN